MPFKDIIVEKKEKVVWITLNKPNVRNAMGKQTLMEISSAIEEIEKDPELKTMTVGKGEFKRVVILPANQNNPVADFKKRENKPESVNSKRPKNFKKPEPIA